MVWYAEQIEDQIQDISPLYYVQCRLQVGIVNMIGEGITTVLRPSRNREEPELRVLMISEAQRQ